MSWTESGPGETDITCKIASRICPGRKRVGDGMAGSLDVWTSFVKRQPPIFSFRLAIPQSSPAGRQRLRQPLLLHLAELRCRLGGEAAFVVVEDHVRLRGQLR